jgi:SNF2 family DNA or RNA helicase
VGRELPGLSIVPQHIDADENYLNSHDSEAIELAKIILRSSQDFKGQKMQANSQFDLKMRQRTGIAKAPFVAEFVRMLVEDNDEKVVLFGWHREVYEIWLEKLKDLKPVMYTGSESPTEKEASKQAFVKGDSKVMIISLRSGAGLDGLQGVSKIAVFGEMDWSPAVHEQNIGRIYRDGQEDPVIAYFLISTSGSDPVMSDILGLKKQQIEGIRNPNQDLISNLQINVDGIRVLAENYLKQRGVAIPKEEATPAAVEDVSSQLSSC